MNNILDINEDLFWAEEKEKSKTLEYIYARIFNLRQYLR